MRRRYTFAALTAAIVVSACASARTAPSVSQRLTPADSVRLAQWNEDISFFASELSSKHPNAFATLTRAQWDSEIAALRKSILSSSDLQMRVGIGRIVASLHDPHTSAAIFDHARYAPVELYAFDEGIFVTGAPAAAGMTGARLVAINDVKIDSIRAGLSRLISFDNDPWLRASIPSWSINPFALGAIGAARDTMNVTFTVEDAAHHVTRVDVATAAGAWPQMKRGNDQRTHWVTQRIPAPNYAFRYVDKDSALYLEYNRCADEPKGSFATMTAQIVDVLKTQPVQRVIVDLRLNGGGSSSVIYPFNSRVREFLMEHPSARAYALVGRHTFSSAAMNALDLRRLGFKLVGEPTGGRPNHFGEVRTFTLPNSKMVIYHSTKKFELVPGNTDSSIMPDVTLPVLFSDYVSGHDRAMEYALSH